jgi:hypothetical protein
MRERTGGALRDRFGRGIERRLAVDARALAALRMAPGGILLVDLARRAANIGAFYTDAGVLPPWGATPALPAVVDVSLHALSGGADLQVALFVLAGLCAAALLAGYHTRAATLLSFVLLVSLHARNPFVLHAGDTLLRRLLFLGVFLPLGARWSVDASRRGAGPDAVAGWAGAALLLQVVVVYATNAVLKFDHHVWPGGLAIQYVFELDRYTTLLGEALAGFPALLTALTWAWLALLVCSPLLLVLTGTRRAALAALFAGMHLGTLATMRLGVFPLVSVAALVPFVQADIWDRLPLSFRGAGRRLDAALPNTGWRYPRVLARLRPLTSAVPAAFVLAVVVTNAVALGFAPAPAGTPDRIEDPTWGMFAPFPPQDDGWYVAPARLDSGDRIDAIRQAPLRWDRPADLRAVAPNERWRKHLWRLRSDSGTPLRGPYARYLCQRWNRHHADGVDRVTLVYVEQPTSLDGPELRTRVDLGTFECPRGLGD